MILLVVLVGLGLVVLGALVFAERRRARDAALAADRVLERARRRQAAVSATLAEVGRAAARLHDPPPSAPPEGPRPDAPRPAPSANVPAR